MRDEAILVAMLTKRPSRSGVELSLLSAAAQWLEVRADVTGDIDPTQLRHHFRGCLLYTLHSTGEGGGSAATPMNRQSRLLQAAKHYDLIALEGERDLTPPLLDAIPPHQRLITWHGPPTDHTALLARFHHLASTPAAFYRLIPQAERPEDALAPLIFLHAVHRSDVVAYAAGPFGFWSRFVAPYLGLPMVFGTAEAAPNEAADPSLAQLIDDYGLPALPDVTSLYGVVGNPVLHSLSPRLHNAAYRALGLPALYVPFHTDCFTTFWQTVAENEALSLIGFPLNGLTVTSPHKEAALEMAHCSSPVVQRAGASNAFIRDRGVWTAETTDAEGMLMLLQEHDTEVAGKRVAVVGCGGSGRVMAATLDRAGADVTLVNRGPDRARLAIELLDLPFIPLSSFNPSDFDMIVHATPVGRDGSTLPFDIEDVSSQIVLMELVYGTRVTPLMARAQALGISGLDGREMLLAQVRCQFRLMTGKNMPTALARHILGMDAELTEAALASVES